jgi:hypothetical protein
VAPKVMGARHPINRQMAIQMRRWASFLVISKPSSDD